MKLTLLLSIALSALCLSVACANPVLFAPSGTTLSTGQIRAEAAFSPDNEHGRYFWLGTGLMRLELNVTRVEKEGQDSENRIGAQWNFLPETFATPAVGFGVTDVTSASDEGIGGYIAVTKALPTGRLPLFFGETRATVGIGAGGVKGPFAAVEMKLPARFFIQAEYDSRDFNGAIGIQPISVLRLKAYTLKNDFFFGAEVQPFSF